MYWRKEMVEVNGMLFQVDRKFKIEYFQTILDKFSPTEVCNAYHCDKVLRGGDGFFYLVRDVTDVECEMI